MIVFLGTVQSSIKEVKAPFMLDGYHGIALHQCREIGPHLVARGQSHGFSHLSSGTCGIFSCIGLEGPSKFMFVQRH